MHSVFVMRKNGEPLSTFWTLVSLEEVTLPCHHSGRLESEFMSRFSFTSNIKRTHTHTQTAKHPAFFLSIKFFGWEMFVAHLYLGWVSPRICSLCVWQVPRVAFIPLPLRHIVANNEVQYLCNEHLWLRVLPHHGGNLDHDRWTYLLRMGAWGVAVFLVRVL